MEDTEIIALYNSRKEQAIRETDRKYSSYLLSISHNILRSHEDSRECLNDTYLRAWNTIPPNCPPRLAYYLGRIIRGLSIDRWRMRQADKRFASEYSISIEELGECFPEPVSPAVESELPIIIDCLNRFLGELEAEERSVFIRRYYFSDGIKDIAGLTGFSESKIKSMLFRMRQNLRELLEKEGIAL